MSARVLVVTAVVLAAAGCGAGADPGAQQSEDRTIDAVTAVELATPGTLAVTTGAPALKVTAGENVIGKLTAEVEDGVLVLDTAENVDEFGDVRYELVLPDLQELRVTGSGGVEVGPPSTLRELKVEGSGDVDLQGLDVEELSVTSSGSGTITVAGSAGTQEVLLEGSGSYDGTGLDNEQAEVTVAGSGRADVEVTGTLVATVEGSGTITSAGGAEVDREVSGSGDVRAR